MDAVGGPAHTGVISTGIAASATIRHLVSLPGSKVAVIYDEGAATQMTVVESTGLTQSYSFDSGWLSVYSLGDSIVAVYSSQVCVCLCLCV